MNIHKSEYLISSPDYTKCPKADRPEFAFIGRSNVGKSSLINMIVDNKTLAKTSGTPGKTQMINHFTVRSGDEKGRDYNWYLVDLPGYGFAKVSQKMRKSWEKMIDDYITKRETLANLFILVDARHTPQQLDIDFVNKLGEKRIPFAIVFTKSDKENQRTVSQNVDSFLEKLKENWEELPPHFVTSAVKKTGRNKMLEFIGGILQEDREIER
ncbi:MAG TPA: ribosome biogenesis GTP-binding protein YihA/YsxC [Chitinophagaceae bacterium]|nr:ribosome biogenesis GTP-binding protein YihA/YsxC [Chitinophagaceae bacterium]